jgi:hypothetical protein
MPVTWIQHKGKRLLFIDVSNLTNDYEKLGAELETVVALVEHEPRHSILVLADLRNTYLNNNALLVLMSNAPFAAPHFRKSAMVIESNSMRRVVLDSVGRFAGQLPKRFEVLESAKDWLVQDDI